MPHVLMYTSAFCPYCVRAEQLLQRKGVEVEKVRIDLEPHRFDEMMERAEGRRTVPQIFIGDVHVGGYDDLAALEMRGELDKLLAG